MKLLRCSILLLLPVLGLAQQREVIVDADTGNEVDDFYALAHILLEPSVEVTALNAAHWQTSHWTLENSMENSHRLNQQLLGELRMDIPTKRGATARMYDWGDRAQHSAAAYEIIKQAKAKEEVNIIVLGALTNVASAVFIAPEIASKLKVFWLGTTLDFSTGVLKRNDFNPLMDPFALDYLLDSSVTLTILPVNVAVAMEIEQATVQEAIGAHPIGAFLLKRWQDHLDGSRKNRVLWDLALVAAFINPEFADYKVITTSKDSGNRPITFISKLDSTAIYQDFFERVLAFERE